jgi:hypothetical protein
MFEKPVESTDTIWSPIGLQDRPVKDFIIFSQDTLLVATELFVYAEDSVSLYITYDGGLNWLPYQNGFGGDYPRCNEIKNDPIQPNILFGLSLAAVAKSMDKGISWDLIYSDWGYAANYHIFLVDYSSGEIWVGGLTGYFENKIIRFTNYGDQYEIMDPVPNSTSSCMVKHPEYPDHLLAGGGGGIFVSNNSGISWEQCEGISGDSGGITDMEISPQNSKVVYATGFYDDDGPIQFFLKISTNFENSWNTIFYDDLNNDYFSNSLAVYQGQSYDNIFITTNRGVYVYKNTNLHINPSYGESTIKVSPNPCMNRVSISTSEIIEDIQLFDFFGNKMTQDVNIRINDTSCDLEISKFPSGTYLLIVEQYNNRYFNKLIKK